MEHLYDKLVKYSVSDYYGFHMPGHKRQQITGAEKLPYEIDITEIEGFDDLTSCRRSFYRIAGVCGRSFSRGGNALSGKWKYCGTFECSTWMYWIWRQDFDGEKLS